MTRASVYNWNNKYNSTGSFKPEDNTSDEQKELDRLQKENAQLKMENDIFLWIAS